MAAAGAGDVLGDRLEAFRDIRPEQPAGDTHLCDHRLDERQQMAEE